MYLQGVIALGTIERKRGQGRPVKMWVDNIKDWTSLSVDDLLDSAQGTMEKGHFLAKASVCASQMSISISLSGDL